MVNNNNKNKKKQGRPTKLTPKIREEFVKHFKAGEYTETACKLVGVSKSTYYSWIKKADESTRSTKYSKFRDEVRKAQAYDEVRNVCLIAKAAKKNWKAAAWILEHRFSERWAKPKYRNGNLKVKCKPTLSDNPDNVSIKEILTIINEENKL